MQVIVLILLLGEGIGGGIAIGTVGSVICAQGVLAIYWVGRVIRFAVEDYRRFTACCKQMAQEEAAKRELEATIQSQNPYIRSCLANSTVSLRSPYYNPQGTRLKDSSTNSDFSERDQTKLNHYKMHEQSTIISRSQGSPHIISLHSFRLFILCPSFHWSYPRCVQGLEQWQILGHDLLAVWSSLPWILYPL